jgi:hypothetical protein
MNYDLDWNQIATAAQVIRRCRARRVLVLTSEWGLPWLQLALPEWERACGAGISLEAVPNRFFGGSIAAAGLLTTLDFAAALKQIGPEPGDDYDLLLLPGIAFDGRGRDLLGRPYTRLRALTGAEIRIV